MVNRKSKNAYFLEHGSLKKRLKGQMAIKPVKKRKDKSVKVQKPKNKEVRKIKVFEFKDEKENIRLGRGLPKVQISGLRSLIELAKSNKANAINIHFQLKEETQNWLFENGYSVEINDLYKKEDSGFKLSSVILFGFGSGRRFSNTLPSPMLYR